MHWINLRLMALSIVRICAFALLATVVRFLKFFCDGQYYQDQGRDWERYAMIKGRILGANEQDPNVKPCSNYFVLLYIDAISILV